MRRPGKLDKERSTLRRTQIRYARFMTSLDFGPATPLTSGPGVDVRANWTPDSAGVVFERLLGGTRGLYQVMADGSGLTDLTLCNLPGTKATGRPAFFGLNDTELNKTQGVLASGGSVKKYGVAEVEAAKRPQGRCSRQEGNLGAVPGYPGIGATPYNFAFVSDRSGRPALWRCNLSTGSVTPLVELSWACHGPSIAAAERQTLLYFEQTKGQLFHVHLRDTDGGTLQLTTAPGVQDQPWLLPDAGLFVYHAQKEGKNLIYLQSTTAGEPRVCLSFEDEGTACVTPFPSPDGQWVAFSCTHSGISQVWVMRVDDTDRQQVTDGNPHSFPAWSPDGRNLVVVRGEPVAERPSGHLWTVPLRGYSA